MRAEWTGSTMFRKAEGTHDDQPAATVEAVEILNLQCTLHKGLIATIEETEAMCCASSARKAVGSKW